MSSSEIINRVWTGTLQVKFVLHESLIDWPKFENETIVNEFYSILNRNSYFHIKLPQILNFFKPFLKDSSTAELNNWWLEYEEVPLKWNWPVGLLYDIHTGLNPEQQQQISSETEKSKDTQPKCWSLILKHGDYPNEYILPIIASSSSTIKLDKSFRLSFLESYWVNQMKETCYILNGSTKAIMSLSKEMSSQLWNSVLTCDTYTFETIFRKLIPTHLSSLKYIPIRIYLPTSNKIYQPLVKPLVNKKRKTLGEVLQSTMPDLFPSSLIYTVSYPLCHGIVLPLETPIVDLYTIMKFMDGFLHISVVLISQE